MARAKPKKTTTVLSPPMATATVAALREVLDQTVRSYIALLEQADAATFATAWDAMMQPPSGLFWTSYVLLPALAFPDDPPPPQEADAALRVAIPIVAPTLALLAFAPGGLRVGPTTWRGQHPAAGQVVGYRVTEDVGAGMLHAPIVEGMAVGGVTRLHRRIVQTLHLLFPLAALDLLALPVADRWAAAQATVGSLTTESALFSEVLTVGGPPAVMGQATKELVDVAVALACVPYGVRMFGYRFEIAVGGTFAPDDATDDEAARAGSSMQEVA